MSLGRRQIFKEIYIPVVPSVDYIHMQKVGYNPSLGVQWETVWDAGGTYPWDTTNGSCTLASTDPLDDGKVIEVSGVRDDWSYFKVNVTLPGTVGTDIRTVFHMEVLDSSSALLGDVSATIDSEVVAKIINDNNQTLSSIMTIPLGYTGYMLKGVANTGKDKDVGIQFRIRNNNGPWKTRHLASLYGNTYDYEFPVSLVLPEKTDIDIRAKAGSTGIQSSCVYDIILEKN